MEEVAGRTSPDGAARSVVGGPARSPPLSVTSESIETIAPDPPSSADPKNTNEESVSDKSANSTPRSSPSRPKTPIDGDDSASAADKSAQSGNP